jgi:hypothetical protein
MKIRPRIRIGDIVKLSKKGKQFPRSFPINSTMVVSDIITGDGIDRSTTIKCRIKTGETFEYVSFYRSELWSTGKNAFN